MIATILKNKAKRFPLAVRANASLKCWQMKRRYERLCRKYSTPSVVTQPHRVKDLASALWSSQGGDSRPTKRPSVLFVGTDPQQDYSGLIQALQSVARVTIFEHSPGLYGQRWPKSAAHFDEVREHNGNALRRHIGQLRNEGELEVIIGQMWGLSMHWKALADARTAGITVVNIAMDDRHAFLGRRLSDGTWGGTLGIAPFVSLSCTAAPECVAWYQAEGHLATFLPEASDPTIFRPGEKKSIDVSFVGARYGIREKLVTALIRSNIKVEAYGTGWPSGRVPTEDVPSLFARSRIILGCGTIGHCEDFFSLKLRDFDAPTSGSMYITHDNPDIGALFDVGGEIVTFKGAGNLIDAVHHYLRAEAEREAIAHAGRERCIREHTWQQRILAVLQAIG